MAASCPPPEPFRTVLLGTVDDQEWFQRADLSVEGRAIAAASDGDTIELGMKKPVTPGDRVFLLRPRKRRKPHPKGALRSALARAAEPQLK